MSLHQPNSLRLSLEPLEDRFLLSATALTAPPADRPPSVPGQYAILPAEQGSKDTAQPAFNGSTLLDRPAPGAPLPAVVYPALSRAAAPLPPRTDRDGDGYLLLREGGHAAGFGEPHQAEALALVRSLAAHSEPPTESARRPASPGPGTPPPPTAEVQPLVPDELPPAHPLTGRTDGESAFPGSAEAEGADRAPTSPVMVVIARTEPEQDAEAAAPAVGSSLLSSGLVPESGDPLAGLLPLDVQALRRNADAFFARLTDLVRGPGQDLSFRSLAPWLLLSGAAAWELALLPRAMRRSGCAVDPFLPGTEDEA